MTCRCAIGNCYSLQKDHETALKNFQRAVQLDSRFAYAHTLCGHEYDTHIFVIYIFSLIYRFFKLQYSLLGFSLQPLTVGLDYCGLQLWG